MEVVNLEPRGGGYAHFPGAATHSCGCILFLAARSYQEDIPIFNMLTNSLSIGTNHIGFHFLQFNSNTYNFPSDIHSFYNSQS